ncbi:MAG: hypothetical protein ABUT39_20770 [Acidobacteriota bacterium]
MAHRLALILLALAAFASLTGSPWLVAFGGAVFPIALIALGAARGGKLGPLRIPLLITGLVLFGVLAALLLLPGGGPDAGSLPLGTMLLLFVLVPVPFVILTWAFIASFDSWFLREEDLEKILKGKD